MSERSKRISMARVLHKTPKYLEYEKQSKESIAKIMKRRAK